MFSNDEFRDLMKKVHPDYVTRSKKGNDKWRESYNFNVVIYPDSLGDRDIKESCEKLGVMCSLSPLHDKDVAESGEIKKAHWHCVGHYKTKKNIYQWYCDCVNAFGEDAFSTVEIVSDLGAYVRYLIHLDCNDEKKFKYDISSICDFNGMDSNKYLFENVGDPVSNVEKFIGLIKEKNFLFYDELSDFLMDNDPVLFASLVKDREVKVFVRDYLRGREHSLWYAGEVEKGYTKIRMENGTDKVIFNREFKGASAV